MAETSGIVELYAQHLEAKASRLVIRSTLIFGFVGALLGGFPLLHVSNAVVPSHLGVATLMLGALAGAYIGYTVGERRAVEVRFQAQLALHQLQVERSLIGRAAPAAPAPAPPAPAAAPAPPAPVARPVQAPPAPVAQPAPVVAAPPVPAPAPVAPAPVSAPPLVHPEPLHAPQPAPPLAPAPLSPVPVQPPAEPPAATVVAPPPLLAPVPPLSSTGS